MPTGGYEMHFPTHTGPTKSFLPSLDPLVEGSDRKRNRGVAIRAAADGLTLWGQRIATGFRDVTYVFRRLPDSEITGTGGLDEFEDAAGADFFEFRDANMSAGVYHKGTFAPGTAERAEKREFDQDFETAVTIRDYGVVA